MPTPKKAVGEALRWVEKGEAFDVHWHVTITDAIPDVFRADHVSFTEMVSFWAPVLSAVEGIDLEKAAKRLRTRINDHEWSASVRNGTMFQTGPFVHWIRDRYPEFYDVKPAVIEAFCWLEGQAKVVYHQYPRSSKPARPKGERVRARLPLDYDALTEAYRTLEGEHQALQDTHAQALEELEATRAALAHHLQKGVQRTERRSKSARNAGRGGGRQSKPSM